MSIIRQHYYTSCQHPETGRSGFQVKAATLDIPSSATKTLEKLLGYRLPPSADPQAVSMHPVSLRYYAPKDGEALLICAQSNGTDEFNRPGNFFVHSLIADEAIFNQPLAPIFYWQSPFWVKRDTTPDTTLPPLHALNATIMLEEDTLWSFLQADPKRKEWLYRLLCAVLDYPVSRRRIVILDTNENIANWIALVTLALPQQYRPWLTFATYHHDPYSVPFLITGTTRDGSFRFTRDEYIAYFVLNAQDGQIAEAPSNETARFLVDHMTKGGYKTVLSEFAALLKRRVPSTREPDSAALGTMARFMRLKLGEPTSTAEAPLTTEQTTQAVQAIAEGVLNTELPTIEDSGDLMAAWSILIKIVQSQPDSLPNLLPLLMAILEQLSEIEPQFEKTCREACLLYGMVITQRHNEEIVALRDLLNRYPPDFLRQTANQSDILQSILSKQDSFTIEQFTLFWLDYGPLLTRDIGALPVMKQSFDRTCQLAHKTAESGPQADPLAIPPEANQLLKAWLRTQRTTEPAYHAVHNFKLRTPNTPIFRWVYYAWVEEAPLQSRKPLRDWFSQSDPGLVVYEMQRDLHKNIGMPDWIVQTIASWLEHVPSSEGIWLLQEGLKSCWNHPEFNRPESAEGLLTNNTVLSIIDDEWQLTLFEANQDNIQLHYPDDTTIELYRRMLPHANASTSPRLRAIMVGTLALGTLQIPPDSVDLLTEYFQGINDDLYEEEVGLMLATFCRSGIDPVNHSHLLAATYHYERRTIFWTLYREEIRYKLIDMEDIAATLTQLDYWFTLNEQHTVQHDYLVPDFFIQLPGLLGTLRSDKGYNVIGRDFETNLHSAPWYPMLRDVLDARRGLRGLFGG